MPRDASNSIRKPQSGRPMEETAKSAFRPPRLRWSPFGQGQQSAQSPQDNHRQSPAVPGQRDADPRARCPDALSCCAGQRPTATDSHHRHSGGPVPGPQAGPLPTSSSDPRPSHQLTSWRANSSVGDLGAARQAISPPNPPTRQLAGAHEREEAGSVSVDEGAPVAGLSRAWRTPRRRCR